MIDGSIGNQGDLYGDPARPKGYVYGTHEGSLDVEQRARRERKNQRNQTRVHPKGAHDLDMPVRGSQSKRRAG